MIFEKNIWGSQWGGYFETARYASGRGIPPALDLEEEDL